MPVIIIFKEKRKMNIEKTIKSLKARNFQVSYFETSAEAADYIASNVKETTVGIGGSKTVEALGLYDRLSAENTVYWHWKVPGTETLKSAMFAKVFISSANAISEEGEILNIDGRGNRVAAQLFGHDKVYIIAGVNKIRPDFASALDRARNVAAVKNVQRFDMQVPCKTDGVCHDCRVKDHACNALTVLWGPMMGMETEIVLINEELGY